uniref:Uncharacterized protein n=1 Tax=Solanum tuberosum TaxID=4113 RepID=M1B0A8_SOLTU
MPGTIQVSVFDFKNISSSSICLWVSMGKRAYQTWDKGDFSFPLTTFRDNLVVRLEDVEGNEISQVETLSIVEKGCWDDVFQLEGGHYVHMKLQFSLSEDERNLIRNVKKGGRSLTRTRASKSQPNLVGIGGSLKDLDSDNISRPNKMSALRLERPLNTVDLPEPQINIGKRGQNSSPEQDFVGTEQPVFHEELKQSSVHIVRFNEAGSSQQETFVSAKKESNTVATSPVDLMRLSNLETATSSQTTSVAHPDVLKANNLAANRDSFNGPSVAEKQNREIRSETLPEVHFEKASNVKPKLIACREDELYDSENSGAWIFPDNKKRLCMTSAGKNIVHLSEDCRIGVDDHQSNKRPSMQETTGKVHGILADLF